MKRYLTLAAALCFAAPAPALPSNEVMIGPILVPADYSGVDVSVPVRAFLLIESAADGVSVRIRLQGDLGNLQGKVSQLIDSFPLPKDNCATYGTNPVVTIWGKQLDLRGEEALLTLHGYVDIWGCVSNPIPNSKLEWRNDGPFHLSIPHVVTWPGDPIKTSLGKQPFDVALPVRLTIPDDHTVALTPGQPSITLGGQYIGVTNGILRIAGIDINAKASEALHHAIDPDKLQAALPPEVLKLNPKIKQACFKDVSGHLGVDLTMFSKVPPDQLTDFFQMMLARKK